MRNAHLPLLTRVLALLLMSIIATKFLLNIYNRNILSPLTGERERYIAEVIHGTVDSPYRYRILVPYVTVAIQDAFKTTFFIADSSVAALSLFLSIFSFALIAYGFSLRLDQTVLALTLCVFAWSTTFRFHAYQAWSYLEPFFLVLAIFSAHRRSVVLYVVATSLAVLNRETGALLAIFALPLVIREKTSLTMRDIARIALLLLAPSLVYLSVCLTRAWAPHTQGLDFFRSHNLSNLNDTQYVLYEYFQIFWIYIALVAARNLRYVGFSLYVVSTLILIYFFGLWHETRLLNSLAALVLLYSLHSYGDVQYSDLKNLIFKRKAS